MKRNPYAANKRRWEWFQSFKRERFPGLGPYEAIVSHRLFFRIMGDKLPPILTPKPIPPLSAAERRFFGRWWGSSIKHRDPRYSILRKPRDDEF